ncbi:hypothetical protein [Burkholderia cepacia]|nr:hypothetical protein [Burkholderia cepacia]MDO5940603.1 hypothetical protein [Burkholderia cepacia]
MKTLLAWIGGGVAILYILGCLGAGQFYVYYGEKPITCTRETT